MTQTSYLVGENNQNASYPNPPHDSGPYTSIQWRRRQRALLTGDRYSGVADPYASGPIAAYLNNLAVTVTPGPPDVVNINTGAAIVDGNLFENDASVSITPSVPGAPPATYTVVVVLNDQNATYNTSLDFPAVLTDYDGLSSVPSYSCRLAILQAAPASLVQTDAVFMVPLYTFSIDGSQNITSLTRLWNWAQTPIAAVQKLDEVVTSATNTITFSSISQNYRHLEVILRGKAAAASTNVRIFFNGDAGANYDYSQFSVNAGVVAGANVAATATPLIGNLALSGSSYSDTLVIEIPDYSRATFRKSATGRSSVAISTQFFSTVWWQNTAAITQIELNHSNPPWPNGVVASLYGRL